MGELAKIETGEIISYSDAKLKYQRIETVKQAILTAQKLGIDIDDLIPYAINILWVEIALGRFLQKNKNIGTKGNFAGRDSSGALMIREPENNIPTLDELGITFDKSSLLQKVAIFKDEIIEEYINLCIENKVLPKTGDLKNKHNLTSKMTGDNEWYTPSLYIEKVRRVLGEIDLDPASNDFAQKTVKAKKYFTIETNGLNKNWKGNIFMNPPYGQPEISLFIDKLIKEINLKNVKSAILLTNNNTDTNWFHNMAVISKLMCFTKGRINFYKRNDTKSGPTNGQIFYYFGDNIEGFLENFNDVGLIMSVYYV